MKTRFIFSLCILFCAIPAFADINPLFVPKGPYTDQIIPHTHYTLGFDEQTEQPAWVIYELTQAEASPAHHYKRKDNFRPDPNIETGSAELSDYKGSGYDRGHLAPAGDMSFSQEAMSESFFMSNMSPQLPSFNRGVWRELEAQVREWAKEERLIVITGGVLQGNHYIGKNKVLVPVAYYKVLYAPDSSRMTAFMLPHQNDLREFNKWTCTVNRVEEITGIDFFPGLENAQEEMLESTPPDKWINAEHVVDSHIETSSTSLPKNQTTHQLMPVKKSRSGICHAPGTKHYIRVKKFSSFESLKACLDSGGRLPKK